MCSIFGGVFPDGTWKPDLISELSNRCRDRGRDGDRFEVFEGDGCTIAIGACRAAPTTERPKTDLQPYAGIVHNGTIANDRELGNPEGEVDSKVLPKVLNRLSLDAFSSSVLRLKGSYAIGAVSTDRSTIYLARNFKPIHALFLDGGGGRDAPVLFASCARHLRWLALNDPFEIPPYSCHDLRSGFNFPLRRAESNKALVIASSGLDSTTAAWMMRAQGHSVDLLHFRYECQAEEREAEAVERIADALGGFAYFWDLPLPFNGGRLTTRGSDVAGPIEGAEFAHEWVPGRNLMFLGMAAAFAEANGYGTIVLGNNLEEAGAYPDNEEEFTDHVGRALDYAVACGNKVSLVTPLARLMKHEIVAAGLRLKVPYELTWSCYKGGERPCRQCGPCFMREEAFRRNGAVDPLIAR